MPNDATHRIINYLALSIFLVINFYFGLEKDYEIIIIFMGSYVLGTEIFTPDLDTDSKAGQRLGILSFPIRKLSRHRGLGHNIFIGWFLKAVYILLVLIIICIIILTLGYNIYWILDYIDIKIIGAFLTGLFLSSGVHIIIDKIGDFK
jgi:uncharacterized metal-binding protein